MSQSTVRLSPSEGLPTSELDQITCSEKRYLTTSLVMVGIAQVILGIGSIVAPHVAAIAVEILLGIVVLIAGCAELALVRRIRTSNGSFWRYMRAACFVGAGVILLLSPLEGIMTLALVLGLTFIFDGGLRVMTATHVNHRRGLLILDGVIGLLVGTMILTGWPEDSVSIVGTVVGIRLLLSGSILLILAAPPGTSNA